MSCSHRNCKRRISTIIRPANGIGRRSPTVLLHGFAKQSADLHMASGRGCQQRCIAGGVFPHDDFRWRQHEAGNRRNSFQQILEQFDVAITRGQPKGRAAQIVASRQCVGSAVLDEELEDLLVSTEGTSVRGRVALGITGLVDKVGE